MDKYERAKRTEITIQLIGFAWVAAMVLGLIVLTRGWIVLIVGVAAAVVAVFWLLSGPVYRYLKRRRRAR